MADDGYKMQRLVYYRDLILVFTHKEIKIRYKSSFLGHLSSVAHPIAFAFVYFIAFKLKEISGQYLRS